MIHSDQLSRQMEREAFSESTHWRELPSDIKVERGITRTFVGTGTNYDYMLIANTEGETILSCAGTATSQTLPGIVKLAPATVKGIVAHAVAHLPVSKPPSSARARA